MRGIAVEVLDAKGGYLRLTHGGTSVVTRESLSELTNAVAMSRCDDKRVARRVVAEAGIRVPEGRTATFTDEDARVPRRGRVGGGQAGPRRAGRRHHRRGDAARGPRPRARVRRRALPRRPARGAVRGRGPAHGRHQRQGGGRRGPAPGRGGRQRRAHRPSAGRGAEPAACGRHPRRVRHPARRRHRGHRARGGLGARRRAARQRAPGGAPHRQPAHRRHHPRRHRRTPPRPGQGRRRRGRRDRHPRHRHRPDGAVGDGGGVRLHRGQRAPGPGQPRAAADRAGVRRPAVPAHRRDAVGLATRPGGSGESNRRP